MKVVRDFHLIVVKKGSIVSVVSEKKQRSERVHRFQVISSEEKQRSECSQIFHFNSSEVKQRSECSQ